MKTAHPQKKRAVRTRRAPPPAPAPPPKAKEPELIPGLWRVSSERADRAPTKLGPVSVRVSKLYYGLQEVTTLEGPTSERSLKELADQYNREGRTPKRHVKAFADYPEGTRLALMRKKNKLSCGPEFLPPRKRLSA